jgi:hypothetical protein
MLCVCISTGVSELLSSGEHAAVACVPNVFLMCYQVFLSSSQVANTPQQSQDAIDLFMREMDSDNDGHISYDEMKVGKRDLL